MTNSEAKKIIGNSPKYAVRNMAYALQMCPWLNTDDDKRRLEAALIFLGKKRGEV